MFKDIGSRNKPFVLLQLLLFFTGLIFGGIGVYTDSTLYLGWMFCLVSLAFLLRGLEVWLSHKKQYVGYMVLGVVYFSVSVFFYPVW